MMGTAFLLVMLTTLVANEPKQSKLITQNRGSLTVFEVEKNPIL